MCQRTSFTAPVAVRLASRALVAISAVIALVLAACSSGALQTQRIVPTAPAGTGLRPPQLQVRRLQFPATPAVTDGPTASAGSPAAATALADVQSTASPQPSPEPASPSPESTPADTPTPDPPPAPEPRPAPPSRIAIPRIGVNARVVPVGLAPDGSMATPSTPTDVAWWEPGYRPGEAGSAVMDAHVDFAGYGAAVFWNLKLLKPGDTITVTADDGTTTTFTVSAVETYAYTDTSSIGRIFQEAGEKELNLITCGGTFDPRTHNYDKRIVVYSSAQ